MGLALYFLCCAAGGALIGINTKNESRWNILGAISGILVLHFGYIILRLTTWSC
jgi:hypothetical protein